uniref:PX domain-containing protein n=1 Tax=Cyprinodon variegatus TaxID=28743 RepID=A0A3Q2D7D6_CYPVA
MWILVAEFAVRFLLSQIMLRRSGSEPWTFQTRSRGGPAVLVLRIFSLLQPLPEKFVVKGMVERFSDDFIQTRRRALQRFLDRVSLHPLLSSSQHLRVFLTEQWLSKVFTPLGGARSKLCSPNRRSIW